MKKLIFPFSFLLIATLLASECGKEKIIIYPETGAYGENILADSLTVVTISRDPFHPKNHSFAAELPKGNSLKVVMKNRTPPQTSTAWSIIPDSISGWVAEDPVGVSQIFTATGPASCDLQINFFEPGNADIYFYENGSEEPTREKNIRWKY